MNEKINIIWYGTASVRITAGSSQLLIDPFFPFSDSKVKVETNAYDSCSHILISHGHFDHISSIREIVKHDTIVYCTEAPYHTLCNKGVNEKNLRLIKPGSSFYVGDMHINAYKGKHISLNIWSILKTVCSRRVRHNLKGISGKLKKIVSCLEKKETLCYVVDVYGKRILILGSLALADGIDYPTDVDLAFFPYQGSKNICDIALRIYDKLRPKAILLTHFDDTFPPFSSEIDTSDFEKHMKQRAKIYKLPHGSKLEI